LVDVVGGSLSYSLVCGVVCVEVDVGENIGGGLTPSYEGKEVRR